MSEDVPKHTHTIAVLVDNESGVLARVIGLFSGRGYNIESLTVAEVNENENLSRITIVTSGSEKVIEQVKSQLRRLVPVHGVSDLTVEGHCLNREMALVKLDHSRLTKPQRFELDEIIKFYGASILHESAQSVIYELKGMPADLDKFIHAIKPYHLIETTRSGVVAIASGASVL